MGTVASLDIDAQKGFTPSARTNCPSRAGMILWLRSTLRPPSPACGSAARIRIPPTPPGPSAILPACCCRWICPTPTSPGQCTACRVPAASNCSTACRHRSITTSSSGRGRAGSAPYGTCFHDLAERRSTGLIEFLHARGVTTVLAGGLATDYCVKTSVLQLRRAGFRVIVHLDACRGIAPRRLPAPTPR